MTIDRERHAQIASIRTMWIVIVSALSLFGLDLFLVLRGDSERWDREALVWLQSIHTGPLDRVFQTATALGGNGRVVPIAAATVFFLATSRRLEVYTLLGAAGIAQGITYALKAIVQRERQSFLDVANLPTDSSFPSGHALGSTVVYGLLAVFLWHGGYRLPAAALVVWALLICISRSYLGVHYPTDVIASVCLGVAFLAATVMVYQHLQATR